MLRDKSTIAKLTANSPWKAPGGTHPIRFGRHSVITLCTLCTWLVPSGLALAAPGTDYFSTTTRGPNLPNSLSRKLPSAGSGSSAQSPGSALAMMSRGSPIVTWFESFDDTVHAFKPSQADRVILNRPFNKEKERVDQWIQVAKKIARNYHLCSQQLRGMSVPKNIQGADGLKEYRDLTADWYLDVATIYEDLIKPRPAAKTMEELEEALSEIKGRAQSLTKTSSSLKAMDVSLRKQHNVHLARHDDALQQYVRGK